MNRKPSNTCTACRMTRKKKSLLYDAATLKPYCLHPYMCNENHPNHPVALVQRGSEYKMYPYDEARERYIKATGRMPELVDAESIEDYERVLSKILSLRITAPEHAALLVELMHDEKLHIDSISDAIRHCIDFTLDARQEELKMVKAQKAAQKLAEEQREVMQELTAPEETDDEEWVF